MGATVTLWYNWRFLSPTFSFSYFQLHLSNFDALLNFLLTRFLYATVYIKIVYVEKKTKLWKWIKIIAGEPVKVKHIHSLLAPNLKSKLWLCMLFLFKKKKDKLNDVTGRDLGMVNRPRTTWINTGILFVLTYFNVRKKT